MSTPDPQLDQVRRTFDTAFRRIVQATTPVDAEDEISNLLGQLYRLHELGKGRLMTKLGEKPGKTQWFASLLGSDDLRAARAAIWARTFDVHRVIGVASIDGVFPDYFTSVFGVPIWNPPASLPEQTDRWGYGRHLDYASFLENRSVLGTSRLAFDAMAKLL